MKRILCVILLFLAASGSLPAQDKASGPPAVVVTTSKGRIVIDLYPEQAPATVANFLKYVDAKFYDNTVFHRVIPNFMIQGGGFTADLKPRVTGAPIRNEADNGLSNKRGSVAMARTMEPHSATAQFFISTVDNAFLDFRSKTPQGWGYAVFGRVVEGMDVVDAIATVRTGNRGMYQNVPLEPVVIESIRRR
jgi:peptidyl-prolyl cis-trans isomerase B (cyclophilin B)